MRPLATAAAVLAGLLCCAGCCPSGTTAERVASLTGIERFSVCAEVASTEAARQRGLAGHAALGTGDGLLLPFPSAGQVCIANGEVTFPIDAVYVDGAGKVLAIETFAAGDTTQVCHDGVRRVLEVAKGVAQTVAMGDRLTP